MLCFHGNATVGFHKSSFGVTDRRIVHFHNDVGRTGPLLDMLIHHSELSSRFAGDLAAVNRQGHALIFGHGAAGAAELHPGAVGLNVPADGALAAAGNVKRNLADIRPQKVLPYLRLAAIPPKAGGVHGIFHAGYDHPRPVGRGDVHPDGQLVVLIVPVHKADVLR